MKTMIFPIYGVVFVAIYLYMASLLVRACMPPPTVAYFNGVASVLTKINEHENEKEP